MSSITCLKIKLLPRECDFNSAKYFEMYTTNIAASLVLLQSPHLVPTITTKYIVLQLCDSHLILVAFMPTLDTLTA